MEYEQTGNPNDCYVHNLCAKFLSTIVLLEGVPNAGNPYLAAIIDTYRPYLYVMSHNTAFNFFISSPFVLSFFSSVSLYPLPPHVELLIKYKNKSQKKPNQKLISIIKNGVVFEIFPSL